VTGCQHRRFRGVKKQWNSYIARETSRNGICAGDAAAGRSGNGYIDGTTSMPFEHPGRGAASTSPGAISSNGRTLLNALAARRPAEFGNPPTRSREVLYATSPDTCRKTHGGSVSTAGLVAAHHTRETGRVTHGTFRPRKQPVYIERSELDNLARCGKPDKWELLGNDPYISPQVADPEEKQRT
jgi:hypothetical protein